MNLIRTQLAVRTYDLTSGKLKMQISITASLQSHSLSHFVSATVHGYIVYLSLSLGLNFIWEFRLEKKAHKMNGPNGNMTLLPAPIISFYVFETWFGNSTFKSRLFEEKRNGSRWNGTILLFRIANRFVECPKFWKSMILLCNYCIIMNGGVPIIYKGRKHCWNNICYLRIIKGHIINACVWENSESEIRILFIFPPFACVYTLIFHADVSFISKPYLLDIVFEAKWISLWTTCVKCSNLMPFSCTRWLPGSKSVWAGISVDSTEMLLKIFQMRRKANRGGAFWRIWSNSINRYKSFDMSTCQNNLIYFILFGFCLAVCSFPLEIPITESFLFCAPYSNIFSAENENKRMRFEWKMIWAQAQTQTYTRYQFNRISKGLHATQKRCLYLVKKNIIEIWIWLQKCASKCYGILSFIYNLMTIIWAQSEFLAIKFHIDLNHFKSMHTNAKRFALEWAIE